MDKTPPTIDLFRAALPKVREWIEQTLRDHRARAVPVNRKGYQALGRYFPSEHLEKSMVVTVPRIPVPPLRRLGLPALSKFEEQPLAGITYVDTFFVLESQESESLYFHELVHVVQWQTLGIDDFLLAYGAGLIQHGYEHSPLEQMAYDLQRKFERHDVPKNLVQCIRDQISRER